MNCSIFHVRIPSTAQIVVGIFVAAITVGCVDPITVRRLELTEARGVDSGTWGPIELDTSQLPQDAVSDYKEQTDGLNNWVTTVRIFPNRPIKIVIMPATQPQPPAKPEN